MLTHHFRPLSRLVLIGAFLTACAAPTPAPVAPAPAEPLALLLARPDGLRGPVVAYEIPAGRERFRLPAGMLSGDERRFVSVAPGLAGGQVTVYDMAVGEPTARFMVRDLELGGVSLDGRWAVFTRARPAPEGWATRVEIVDTATGAPAHRLDLAGRFELDAFSADGQSLFLIEHLPADAPDAYVIRRYELGGEGLLADPVRAKGAETIMAGYAWEGKASPDGRWLLTLYINTLRDAAFVHALNLVDKLPVCIDLPSGTGDLESLQSYTVAPDPNGQRLFAANAALGVVAEVSLVDFRVTHTTAFPPQAPPTQPAGAALHLAASRLTPDARTLYFTNGQAIWAYSLADRRVSEPFTAAGPITGLAFDPAGTRLFAATAAGEVQAFPAAPAAR
ncbi:MAG: hypothetical protein JNK29_18600 [Anaerolineales bacterium]|nr:hypothetical protein [Anaerolineales bacterium]